MASGLLFLLLVSAPCWAQISDYDDENKAFDWLKFSKGTENEYEDDLDSNEDWDSDEALDIQDRSVPDYELREVPPFEKVCEIHLSKIHRNLNLYEYKPHPDHNVTCSDSTNKDPLNYSRHQQRKEFCILGHQNMDDRDLCKTVFVEIPVAWRRKKSHDSWTVEKLKFGIGCRCYRGVGPWYGFSPKRFYGK